MSFILDALKKAESERNRRVAPLLMDARVAPPRRGLPAWGWALGIVLLVNLVVLGWLLLRSPPPQDAAVVGMAAATSGTPDRRIAETPDLSAAAPSQMPGAASDPLVIAPDDVVITPNSAAPANGIGNPWGGPAPPANNSADTTDPASLPSLAQLRGAGASLPELEMSLHIYDPLPALRSVLLNGQRLVEGEYLPNGVKVERITPGGVVLEAAGRRFRLDTGS